MKAISRTLIMTVLAFVFAGLLLASPKSKGSADDLMQQGHTIGAVRKVLMDKCAYELDGKEMFYGQVRGMLSPLDPHSEFETPEMMEEMKIGTKGELSGVGIQITLDNDGVLTVITPIIDSPAYEQGVRPGDKILKVDGESTEGMRLQQAVSKLRGKKGTEVTISVLHEGEEETEDITITRNIIKVSSVKGIRRDPVTNRWEYMLDEEAKIGYIWVTSFQQHTVDRLAGALKELEGDGVRALIVDLRFNFGGLLSSSIDVTDLFIDEGVIVSTRGRSAPEQEYRASVADTQYDLPLVVLVDEGTASASEIFAGAIRDHKRGLLVGAKTFGKGSVQSILGLNGGMAIKLTTAKYYTPSGVSIHEIGIEPDIEVKMSAKMNMELRRHRRERDIIRRDKDSDDTQEKESQEETKDDEKESFIDLQLQRAVDVLNGILLYQGRQAKVISTAPISADNDEGMNEPSE